MSDYVSGKSKRTTDMFGFRVEETYTKCSSSVRDDILKVVKKLKDQYEDRYVYWRRQDKIAQTRYLMNFGLVANNDANIDFLMRMYEQGQIQFISIHE